MTNEEAIQTIKSECYISDLLDLDRTRMVNSALDKAVEALKAEPCEDCISRQAVIDTIETDCSWDMFDEFGNRTPTGECIIEAIKRVPSVEPIAKNATTTEDCVSRQDVLNTLYREWHA